jgi:F420-non-reducing hydrogenase small subunit
MPKPQIALYWCSSCGGCEESVLDLAEDLLALTDLAEIVFWPIAMDAKYRDIEAVPDGQIAVTLINGAIRDDAQAQMACLLRKKSQLLMAHGSCAHLGGVVGLANFFEPEALLNRAYREMPTLDGGASHIPQIRTDIGGAILSLPTIGRRVKVLSEVVAVDYYLPGCPPPPELIKKALRGALAGTLPPRGSVLADARALCHTCPHLDSKPEKIRLKRFKRLHETLWDPQRCFLDQALICLGPVTRGGCDARCIYANMPCRGCFGPLDTVSDQGAKALSMLAALMGADDIETVTQMAAQIPDPAGLLYRYSLAVSLLKGRVAGKPSP